MLGQESLDAAFVCVCVCVCVRAAVDDWYRNKASTSGREVGSEGTVKKLSVLCCLHTGGTETISVQGRVVISQTHGLVSQVRLATVA